MRRFLCLAVVLLAPTPALAVPPTVTDIVPRGAERGKAVTIVVSGSNLTAKSKLIFPYPATQRILADAKPNPNQLRFEINVAPAVPVGIYPVRLLTEEGITAVTFFGVDAFPSALEVEDNSSFDKAQKVPFPVIVSGQCGGGDVDFYRFHVKKGQRVVIETEAARLGSGILPQIRVTDERRRLIAADDTQRLRGDCRLWFVATAEGDYVVEFSDSRYRGGAPPYYRLKIADYDFAEEVFPLGGRQGDKVDFSLRGGNLAREVRLTQVLGAVPADWPAAFRLLAVPAAALKPGMLSPEIVAGTYPEQLGGKDTVAAPVTINGRLEKRGEIHRYQLPVQAGQRFRIAVEAESLGSYLDGVLRVTDQTGKQLARVDDVDLPPVAAGQPATKTADPALDITVPAGVTKLGIELRDGLGRGGINYGYRLTIEPARADFTLEQAAGEVNVPLGSSALVAVAVQRRGYTGPVQMSIPGLPKGLSVEGGYVPEGATSGLLTVTAARGAILPGPLFLSIEGRGLGAGADLPKAVAEQRIVLSRDGNVAASTLRLARLALALTGPAPFTVEGPASVEVIYGYPTIVPVTVARGMKPAVPAIELTGIASTPGTPLPAGLTLKPGTAAPGAGKASFIITATPKVPQGRHLDLVVQGKAKIANQEQVVIGPAVILMVAKPFAVELLAPAVTLKPGQTALVKGRLKRRPVFREPVQLKLDGLPKGLTLKHIQPIAATQNEFQIELRADGKAVATVAKLTLSCSTIIAGVPYSHPPVTVTVPIVASAKR